LNDVHTLAIGGVDTAENEPAKILKKLIVYLETRSKMAPFSWKSASIEPWFWYFDAHGNLDSDFTGKGMFSNICTQLLSAAECLEDYVGGIIWQHWDERLR